MGIRIDEINVRRLGPITDFQWKLGKINLIYGRNESGKTYLVEFLLRALFKNISYPGIRKAHVAGQVLVSGLTESTVRFSPSAKKKIEEYLAEDDQALPPNISRLLVVRAGELSLVEDAHIGVNRSIFEEYLSNTGLINRIQSKIQLTVRQSTIENGVIKGKNNGQVKEYHALKDILNALDTLIGQINGDYSSGHRASIQEKLNGAQEQFDEMMHAKCHLALKLSQEIQTLEQHLGEISEEALRQLQRDIDEYRSKSESCKRLEETCQTKNMECAELSWLKGALEEYQTLTLREARIERPWIMIFAGIFLAGAIALIFFRQPYLAAGATVIGMGLGYWYVHKLRQGALASAQNAEIARISDEFEHKFNQPLTDLATLRMVHDEQQENAIAARQIADQIAELRRELTGLEQRISDNLYEMVETRLPVEACEDKVGEIERNVRGTKKQLETLKIRFAELGVTEPDFRKEPSLVDYDETRFKMLQQRLDEYRRELQRADEGLNSLRQRLAQETRMDISTPWEKLIKILQEKRVQTAREYRSITAEVLAGIVVNTMLDELYKVEEKSIQEGLRSCNVVDHIEKLTTHYNRIEYDHGEIRVADAYSEYNYNELSTATQEQILLALRMGFSSRCFFDQGMFLVLDDAFQHSDWNRREYLIEGVLNITQQGWQIIYLTMDDHIRDVFRERAQALAPHEFQYIEL